MKLSLNKLLNREGVPTEYSGVDNFDDLIVDGKYIGEPEKEKQYKLLYYVRLQSIRLGGSIGFWLGLVLGAFLVACYVNVIR